MLRVIPVLDVLRGQAVRAIAGDRDHYRPIAGGLHPGSDPMDLALGFRDRLGIREIYLADLDAIRGGARSWRLYETLKAAGLRLWLDAGVRSPSDAQQVLNAGVDRVILGSETLDGPGSLSEIASGPGADRLVFGLDLRDGVPWLSQGADWGTLDPRSILGRALEVGIGRFLVLDVARVGLGSGVGTEPLVAALRASAPSAEILAGGGIRGPADLRSLERAGATVAIVGSALLDGRIGPEWCR